jgi:hypothetical protein
MESGGGGRDAAAAAAAAEADAFTMLSRMRAVRTARRVPASFKILLVEEDDIHAPIHCPRPTPAPIRGEAHSSFLAGDVNQNKTP